MKLKKRKDLDKLKQVLQDKTEIYEKTKYSLERLTEEYMEGIIDRPIGKQQKQYMKKIESLEKDISKIQEKIYAFEKYMKKIDLEKYIQEENNTFER